MHAYYMWVYAYKCTHAHKITCTIARLQASKHRQCIRLKIQKGSPVLSHFLFSRFFSLLARIADRNVRDIAVNLVFVCLFLYKKRYKWWCFRCTLRIHCHCWHLCLVCILPPLRSHNHLLWSSFSSGCCCEILSQFIASVYLLYNQRKNNIMKAKQTPPNGNWTKKESVDEGGWKNCIRTEFKCFHYVAECVVLCPALPFLYET